MVGVVGVDEVLGVDVVESRVPVPRGEVEASVVEVIIPIAFFL